MARHVGTAVVSEITSRAVSKILEMLTKQAAVGEKLRKLEMLCLKIHSTVEASEKHGIASDNLLKWQEKLQEAATDGDEVLFSFRWRALNEASSRVSSRQKSTPSALTYTKIAMSSLVKHFHSAARMLLLSCDKDVKKLNSTVEKMEKLSADTGEFLTLVELEVLAGEEHAPAKG